MTTLFYSPAACSISVHLALEELGGPYQLERVLTKQGGTRTPQYLSMNPKGKVPVLLLDDGSSVTETPVVLQFLAVTDPQRKLLPEREREFFEVLQICEYLSNTVHNYGLTRLFRPQAFSSIEAEWPAIREEGAAVVRKAFDLLAGRLNPGPFLFDRFTIADASLFFFELHASRLRLAMPAAVRSHFDRLLARPSAQTVMAREQLDSDEFLPA